VAAFIIKIANFKTKIVPCVAAAGIKILGRLCYLMYQLFKTDLKQNMIIGGEIDEVKSVHSKFVSTYLQQTSACPKVFLSCCSHSISIQYYFAPL
jgi:hypothetical protein